MSKVSKKFEARWLGSRTKQVACKRLKKSYRSFRGAHDREGTERMLGMAHDLKCNWQKPVLKKLTRAKRQRIVGPIKFK